MEKICLYCGKKFETDRKIKKFCCTKCQVNYNNQIIKEKRANEKKYCRYCRKEFSQKWNEQYCSENCRIQARRERQSKKTEVKTQHTNKAKEFFKIYCSGVEPEYGINLCNTFFGDEGREMYWQLRKEYISNYGI